MIRPPPRSTLFPHPPLSRSARLVTTAAEAERDGTAVELLDNPVRPYAWGSRTVIAELQGRPTPSPHPEDRKSTRLNSSHANISYAVFCLKKKKTSVLTLRLV